MCTLCDQAKENSNISFVILLAECLVNDLISPKLKFITRKQAGNFFIYRWMDNNFYINMVISSIVPNSASHRVNAQSRAVTNTIIVPSLFMIV
jgi:hypothetical protein